MRLQEIIIFGYSDLGLRIYNDISPKSHGVIIKFCENSLKKQGKRGNLEILSIEESIERFPNALYILASKYHKGTMRQQLLEMGIPKEHIVDAMEEYIQKQVQEETLIKHTPRQEIEFEIAICDHCNLNCKSCNAFSPLAKEVYLDLEEYRSDMKRMGEIFHYQSGKISILGGEPLLNPQIIQYLEIARNYFPSSEIAIITNGILLNRMPEHFWEDCHRYLVKLIITRYPIKINEEEIANKAEKYGVKWEYYGNALSSKYMFLFPLDFEKKQDPEESFSKCMNANKCITLRHGKLFTCSTAAYSSTFESYFHRGVQICDKDYINIYSDVSGEEILKFLSQPIPFCGYCDVKNRNYEGLWNVSQRSIKEWSL